MEWGSSRFISGIFVDWREGLSNYSKIRYPRWGNLKRMASMIAIQNDTDAKCPFKIKTKLVLKPN